jgi:hypothetical protein
MSPWSVAEKGGSGGAAVAAIAATFAYFLLFDQFALLDLLQAGSGGAASGGAGVRVAMAAMGVCGLLASLLLGWRLGRAGKPAWEARRFLLAGYALAAAVAGLAPPAAGGLPVAVSGAAGVATALITVPLAAGLRRWMSGAGFGWRVGLGTGLAYFCCNLPPVFAGSPELRCLIAAGFALAGLAAAWRLPVQPAAEETEGPAPAAVGVRGLDLAGLLLSLLALVWLDSAAFAVIQETAGLKGKTWGGGWQLLVLGGVHLLAALGAGRLIDAGRFRGLLLGAFGLFCAALLLLGAAAPASGGLAAAMVLGGPLYAAAVSLYSVPLVVFASRGRLAGPVFGIAGWLGSALGVGMAQDLHRVPPLFLAVAGGLLLLAALLERRPSPTPWRGLARHGLTALFALAATAYFGLEERPGPPTLSVSEAAAAKEAAARGRLVYIAEGCIYCHSQYVRPGTRDEALWGPHRALDRERERPPLIGLRRQGPDLSNVGRRHAAALLRLQLEDPRAVEVFSAMPSYRHLFASGDSRGEDLVAYLESLR